MENEIGLVLSSNWWLLATALGIPSLLVSIFARRLEKRIDRREEQREKRADEWEKQRMELDRMLIQSTTASIALGEATARAVQRIPDAHCNGDMHAALDYAAKVKHEQKDFLTALGIHALYEE